MLVYSVLVFDWYVVLDGCQNNIEVAKVYLVIFSMFLGCFEWLLVYYFSDAWLFWLFADAFLCGC